MLNIEKRSLQIWSENRNLLLYLITIGCILFSYELVNFSLTIDEEIQIPLIDANRTWIQQGRWGMYFLSAVLLPNPIIPVIPTLIAILFSAFAYILVIRILSSVNSSNTAQYMSAPFFIGCPTLYYVYHFDTLSYGIGIGFFIAAVGNYIYLHTKNYKKLFSIVAFSFAIAIYQTFLLFIIIIFLFKMFNDLLFSSKHTIKSVAIEIAKFSSIILLSLILYFFIREISYFIFDVSDNGYTSNFFNFTNSFSYWGKTIPATMESMAEHYLGDSKIYGTTIYSLAALLALSIGSLILKILRTDNEVFVKSGSLVVLLSIIFMPFLLNLTNGGFMPTRALIAIPIAISGIVYFGWISSGKFMKYFIGVVAASAALQFAVVNNRFSLINQLSWEADKQLAFRLQSRIDELNIKQNTPISLEIVGIPEERPPKIFSTSQTIANSFFSFNGGNIYRIILFFNTLAISNYEAATIEERKQVMSDANEMPNWPNPKAIAIKNNILIIKFGDYSYQQHQVLCVKNENPPPACDLDT